MTITATQRALDFLEEREGAVLYWQAPAFVNWAMLVDGGVVLFDKDTDCYVHPAAVKLENPHGSSWRMPVLQDYHVLKAESTPVNEVYVEVAGPNDGRFTVTFFDCEFKEVWNEGRKPHPFEVPLIKRVAEEALR